MNNVVDENDVHFNSSIASLRDDELDAVGGGGISETFKSLSTRFSTASSIMRSSEAVEIGRRL
jgi:hypothetical protein